VEQNGVFAQFRSQKEVRHTLQNGFKPLMCLFLKDFDHRVAKVALPGFVLLSPAGGRIAILDEKQRSWVRDASCVEP
tara:strand:- start:889 stop:1119 length:231 start_codon:yes stop_codon:yes gene_type:complete